MINPWTTQNNVVLNPRKCKEMIVRFRLRVERSPPTLTVDNKTLETVDSHKVLGVTLRIRTDKLCSETFERIKRPELRLNHLIPVSRACAHRRSLHFSARPTLIKRQVPGINFSYFLC